ncbi:cell wall-binding repeat-containing protein, partial [Bacillus sp. SIMBA_069]
FVASGVDFPDALSASAAAGKSGAPLLLTLGGAVPATVGGQLSRIGPSHISVVGGSSVISDGVQSSLGAYVK